MATMLRVHSQDLHEHIVQEAGECLGSGLYTDLGIRCQDGVMVQCHRLVMSAVSPYLKQVLDVTGDEEHTILDLPDSDRDVVQSLLDIIYTGSIETSLDMIRNMLTLAHSLYIAVPVSDQLMSMLGLQLPQQQSLVTSNNSPSKPPGLEFPGCSQQNESLELNINIMYLFSEWVYRYVHVATADTWPVCHDEWPPWSWGSSSTPSSSVIFISNRRVSTQETEK